MQDVLGKTPLKIAPRRELPRFGKFKHVNTAPLIDFEAKPSEDQKPVEEPVTMTTEPVITVDQNQTETSKPDLDLQEEPDSSLQNEKNEEKLTILGFEEIEKPSPSKSPQNLEQSWDLKQTNSLELLTPSPLGFTPFDSRSLDELMTPDDFGSEHLAPGLGNINYDIDLSDFSGDNSIAEDAPKPEAKDPFSPDGLKKDIFDPFAPQTSTQQYKVLESFDEFSLVDSRTNQASDPFEIVSRGQDPFSPVGFKMDQSGFDPFSPGQSKAGAFLPAGLAETMRKDPFCPEQKTQPSQSGIKVTVQPKGIDPFSPNMGDPFNPSGFKVSVEAKAVPDPFTPEKIDGGSILDDSDSPTTACLLPSPLQPQSSKPA